MMPTLPEAIIEAFNVLGGERTIKEIKDWIYVRYGNRWKDISTSMADMVPVSHGGNHSSQILSKYRVLNKVSRGTYSLLQKESDIVGVHNSKRVFTEKVHIESKQPVNYLISSSNNTIEVLSTKRLPFQPTDWQLELRNSIRSHLRLLRGDDVFLKALYKSMSQDFFDIENVLFYNVGPSAFSHLNIKSLQFERAYEQPPTTNEHQHFAHYQSYKIIEKDESVSEYWMKTTTLAAWKDVTIPKLSSEVKPYAIWYAMKTGLIKILDKQNSHYYGLEVTIKAPKHTQVNVVSVIKPLLDGIISAFHYVDSTDIDEVVSRLNKYLNQPEKQLKYFLLDCSAAILGPRNVIQPYRNGVKWNPEDDAFQFFKITIEPHHQNDNWIIGGEIFTISQTNGNKEGIPTWKQKM